jgi:hypothetical protein
MADLQGGKFWIVRARWRDGSAFNSPQLLWQSACEYFEWCQANPWQLAGKNGEPTTRVRPMSLGGFCLFIGYHRKYLSHFKRTCNAAFMNTITRIEDTIATHKFEGAAVGAFNPQVIVRDLSLFDMISTEDTGEVTILKIGYGPGEDGV